MIQEKLKTEAAKFFYWTFNSLVMSCQFCLVYIIPFRYLCLRFPPPLIPHLLLFLILSSVTQFYPLSFSIASPPLRLLFQKSLKSFSSILFCHFLPPHFPLCYVFLSFPPLSISCPPPLLFCTLVFFPGWWGSRLMCHVGDYRKTSSITALPALHRKPGEFWDGGFSRALLWKLSLCSTTKWHWIDL